MIPVHPFNLISFYNCQNFNQTFFFKSRRTPFKRSREQKQQKGINYRKEIPFYPSLFSAGLTFQTSSGEKTAFPNYTAVGGFFSVWMPKCCSCVCVCLLKYVIMQSSCLRLIFNKLRRCAILLLYAVMIRSRFIRL